MTKYQVIYSIFLNLMVSVDECNCGDSDLVDVLHRISDSFHFSPRNIMLFADGMVVILV